MSEVRVARATPEDVPRLPALIGGASDWSAEALERERRVGRELWVAWCDERLAGWLLAWHVADEMQLMFVAVSPWLRRRGVGRRLVTHLVERARELGCARIDLEVHADNAAAIALYRELGFAEVGRRPGYYTGGGDAWLMSYSFG